MEKTHRHGVGLPIISALMLSGIFAPAFAACPAMFSPIDFAIHPDEDAKVFVTYSEIDRLETLVIKPTFFGNAIEFGMVLPVPDRPEINEAPKDLFDQLEIYAGGIPDPRMDYVLSSSYSLESSGVTVIEQRDVGDFETSILTATSASGLIDWLVSNGLDFGAADEENFEYYIQKGGYYFVALKINMDEAATDADGNLSGELRPIEFVFKSENPMLPLRIMANDMEPMSFVLYTLTEIPYYIPGSDVYFYEKIPTVIPGSLLERYDPGDKWLVLTNIEFDPTKIKENVLFKRAADLHDGTVRANWELPERDPIDRQIAANAVRFDPHLLPSSAGIMDGAAPTDLLLIEFAEKVNPKKQMNLGIPAKSIECKEEMSLILAPDGERPACIADSNVTALSERGWGESSYRIDELGRLK